MVPISTTHARDVRSKGAWEVGIDAWEIGAIEIADRFSLVEVSDEVVDPVIAALRGATIRGKRLTVRLDKAKGRRVSV